MIIPKEWKDNLKNSVVTEDMLGSVLYSYNKRAKNMRDKRNEYRNNERQNRYYYSYYDNAGNAEKKMEAYYACKDELLKYLTPICVHIVKQTVRDYKVYDYEKGYNKACKSPNALYENCYYDYEEEREVWFVAIGKEIKQYFAYYVVGDYSFHHPIDHPIEGLPIKDIGELETFGKDISELISVQTCDKIRKGLADGTYHLILNNNDIHKAQQDTNN